jgi:hypothetical protein
VRVGTPGQWERNWTPIENQTTGKASPLIHLVGLEMCKFMAPSRTDENSAERHPYCRYTPLSHKAHYGQ